jgi:PKD domain
LRAAKGTTHSIVTRFVAIITILSTFTIFAMQREARAQTGTITISAPSSVREDGGEIVVLINPPQPRANVNPQSGPIPGLTLKQAKYNSDFTFVGWTVPGNTDQTLVSEIRIQLVADGIPEESEYIPIQVVGPPGVATKEVVIRLFDIDAGFVTVTQSAPRATMTCPAGTVPDLRDIDNLRPGLASLFVTGTNARSDAIAEVSMQYNAGEGGLAEVNWKLPLGMGTLSGFTSLFPDAEPVWETRNLRKILLCFRPRTYVGFSKLQQTSATSSINVDIVRKRGFVQTNPDFFSEDTAAVFTTATIGIQKTSGGVITQGPIATFSDSQQSTPYSITATSPSTLLTFGSSSFSVWPVNGPIFATSAATVDPVPANVTTVAFTTASTAALEGQTALGGRNLEIPFVLKPSATQPRTTTVVNYRLVPLRINDRAFSVLTGSTLVTGSGAAQLSIPIVDNTAANGDEQWRVELVDGPDYRVDAASTAVSQIVIRDDDCAGTFDSRPGRSFSMQLTGSPCGGSVRVAPNPATTITETAAAVANTASFDFSLAGATSNGNERALIRIEVLNADGTPATPVSGDAGFDLDGDGAADPGLTTTLSFANSATPRLFVRALNDSVVEPNRTLRLTILSSTTGIALVNGFQTTPADVVVVDDDSTGPKAIVSVRTIDDGETEKKKTVTLTFDRALAPGDTFTYSVDSALLSANPAESTDFTPVSGTVTAVSTTPEKGEVAANDPNATFVFTVPIVDDGLVDPGDTLELTIVESATVKPAVASTALVIVDNDLGPVVLKMKDQSLTEGDTKRVQNVQGSIVPLAERSATVQYEFLDGSGLISRTISNAGNGGIFTGTPGTATSDLFGVVNVPVTINGNTTIDLPPQVTQRIFRVRLFNLRNAVFANGATELIVSVNVVEDDRNKVTTTTGADPTTTHASSTTTPGTTAPPTTSPATTAPATTKVGATTTRPSSTSVATTKAGVTTIPSVTTTATNTATTAVTNVATTTVPAKDVPAPVTTTAVANPLTAAPAAQPNLVVGTFRASLRVTPTETFAPGTVIADGRASTLAKGTRLVSWSIDFADGTVENGTGTLPGAIHVYKTPGTYLVTLTITDDRGAVSNAKQTVVILGPLAPIAGLQPRVCFVGEVGLTAKSAKFGYEFTGPAISVDEGRANSLQSNLTNANVPFTFFDRTSTGVINLPPGLGNPFPVDTKDPKQTATIPFLGVRFNPLEYSLANGDVVWNLSSIVTAAPSATVITNENRCPGNILRVDGRVNPTSVEQGGVATFDFRAMSSSASNGDGAVAIVIEAPGGNFDPNAVVSTPTNILVGPNQTTTTRPKGVVPPTTTTPPKDASQWKCAFDGRFAACVDPKGLFNVAESPFVSLPIKIPVGEGPSFVVHAALDRTYVASETPQTVLRRFLNGGPNIDQPARFAPTTGATTVALTVTGFTVDAGPDQPVANQPAVAAVPNADRSGTVPAVLTLDGTRTTSDGRDQVFVWTQTVGPAVTWQSTSPAFSGKGVGKNPQFLAPSIRVRTTLTFRLDVTATGASSVTTKSDTVTVTLDPPPNNAPVISALTSSPSSQAIAAGVPFSLLATATDPDGDAISYSWKVVSPAVSASDNALIITQLSSSANGATLRWPATVALPDQATVELTVTDARGAKSARTVDVGRPLPALSVTLDANATAAVPGQSVSFTAVPSSIESGLTFTWRQTSGAAVVLPADTTTRVVNITMPTSTANSAPITLAVTLAKGTRSATASDTVGLGAPSPLSVDIDSPGLVAYGAQTTITPTISGGLAPYSFAWVTEVGQTNATMTNQTTGAFTFTAPTLANSTSPVPLPAALKITVRDAAGQEVSARTIVVYGPALDQISTDVGQICGRGILGRVITDGVKTFSLGSFVVVNLGTVTLPGACNANTQVNFSGASASFFGGSLVGTGLSGTVNASTICLTNGQLNADAAFGLPAADITTTAPICVNISALTGTPAPLESAAPGSNDCLITGLLTYNKLPFLDVPEAFSLNRATLAFECGKLKVDANGTVAGGAFTLAATVKSGGDIDGSVNVTNATVFGGQLNLSGNIRKVGANVSYSIEGGIDNPQFGIPGVTVARLNVRWDKTGLHGSASGSVTPTGASAINVQFSGDFRSSTNWSLSASATTGRWEVSPGLVLKQGSLAGSLAQSGSKTTFDVTLEADGEWTVIGPNIAVLKTIKARISNTTPDSAICPTLTANELFVSLSGDGTVLPPGATTPIEISTSGCIGLSSAAFRLKLNAKLNSWRPIAAVDATIEQLAFVVERSAAGQFSIEGQGAMRARGVVLSGRVIFLSGGGFIVDGGGDVSALGIPLITTGHIIFSSSAQTAYQTKKFAGGQFVNDFAPFDLPAGLTLAAGFSLTEDMQRFLNGKLNLNVGDSLVVITSLSGNGIELKVQLNFGSGIDLFRTCPALTGNADPATVCADDNTATYLKLTSGFLSISTGSFGIGAAATLHLPSPGEGGSPTDLPLGAQLTISFVPPPTISISLALYKTGNWENALGIPGLTLGDLAIQGGIVINPPPAPPTPTIAFLATINQLPGPAEKLNHPERIDLETPFGIVRRGEGMRFAFQISQSAPIFELTLGKQDNQIFMRPLAMAGGKDGPVARSFEVDYATVVVAPLGGKIGPVTYEPGFTMGFAANVLGTPIEMKVRLGLIPPELEAHASIGRVSVNGITLDGAVFDMRATSVPPTFHLEISGSADLGDPTMNVRVLTDLDPSGQKLLFQFDGSLSNWVLNPATKLDNLSINAKAELTSFASPPTLSLVAKARGTVLGSPSAFAGTVLFNGTTLQKLDIQAAPGSFSYLGTTLRGYRNTNGNCSTLEGVAANSPCIRLRWGVTDPLLISMQAGITSGPAAIEFEGGIDDNGIGASGEMRVDGATSPTQPPIAVTASLWTRPLAASAIPAARRPKVPRRQADGTYLFEDRGVVDGDWYVAVSTNGSPLTIATIPITASLSAGKVSGTTFVAGKAASGFALNSPVTNQPVVDSNIQLSGVFTKTGSTTQFDLLGKGAIRVDGHPLADATVHLTEQGAAVNGKVTLPGITSGRPLASATLSGGICVGRCPNLVAGTETASATAVSFRLKATANLDIPDLNMDGDLELVRVPGLTQFNVKGSTNTPRWTLNVSGNVTSTTTRTSVCLSGDATLKFSDVSNATGTANFCSDPFVATITLRNSGGYRFATTINGAGVRVTATTPRLYAPSVNQNGFGACLLRGFPLNETLPDGYDTCREFAEMSGTVELGVGSGSFAFVGTATIVVGSEGLDTSKTRKPDYFSPVSRTFTLGPPAFLTPTFTIKPPSVCIPVLPACLVLPA